MERRREFLQIVVGGGLAAGLGGCAAVGPDFSGPGRVRLPEGWEKRRHHKDPHLARWWKIYHDRDLDRLVQLAYRQNLDLKSAGLRILQARAVLGIQKGMAFPQVQQLSGSATVSDNNKLPSSDSVKAGFDLGWELDLWGKYARGTESAEAQLYAAIASYDDILVTVIAEVARNYIAYRTAQERIAYARRNIAIQEYVTKVTEIQFNSGNVSELDMQQARTQLHSTRSALYDLQLSRIRARNALALLLGLNPDEADRYLTRRRVRDDFQRITRREKGTIQLKEGGELLGISLIPRPRFDPRRPIDAELITRRPDVRVAEYQAHAQSAQIGVATAALYPSFSLIGNIGYSNPSAIPFTTGHSIGVIAGPSFAWNIFQYGRIRNNIRLQDARFEEALVRYNKTVLGAVHEVSYALDNYRYTRKQLLESEAAVKASVRAFNISMRQYNDGLVSYQRLLKSVESLTRYQDQYARLRGDMATQVALLYKALGGGWQISRGGRYLSEETVRKLKERTDWGKMLEKEQVILPKGWEG